MPVKQKPQAKFRGRTDLSTVKAEWPPLEFHGTAYRGWPSLVVGPTGSAKTLVCRWLIFEALRAGMTVAHADQEMGSPVTRAYYEAMGATAKDLAAILYYDMPSPTHDEIPTLLQELLDDGVDALLLDKLPDFLRTANLGESSNDDVNEWMAAFVERIQYNVTSLIIDATGHDKRHARGGSEKDYKVALSWMVDVLDEPKKDHIGRVRWTCTKDRFGAVGRDTTIEFAIGGNGIGGITASVIGVGVNSSIQAVDQRRRDTADAWRVNAVITAKKHAPDEAHAIPKSQLEGLMNSGRASDKRRGIDDAMSDLDPSHERLGSKPRGRAILVWWKKK